MIRLAAAIKTVLADRRGAVAVETALVAPVLVMMSLGTFQVSAMVARQSELQSAIFEASSIALASPPTTSEKRTTLKSVIAASTGLTQSQITLTSMYRCGSQTRIQSGDPDCGGSKTSSYIKIELRDTYTPMWTRYGVGHALDFKVNRYVLIKQLES